MNSRFLSALFPSAAQAHAAAEVLERRGVVLLAMETELRWAACAERGLAFFEQTVRSISIAWHRYDYPKPSAYPEF